MAQESESIKNHEHEWHALKTEQVLSHFEVQDNGLSTKEAKKRLEHYGPNQLKESSGVGIWRESGRHFFLTTNGERKVWRLILCEALRSATRDRQTSSLT